MHKIITILGCIFTSMLFANIDIQKAIIERPQPDTYSAKVLTTISGGILTKTQNNQSTIYIKGDKHRTDSDLPTSNITVSAGNKAWIIGPEGVVTELEPEKTISAKKTPEEILAAFNFTENTTKNNFSVFTGTPKSTNPQEMFSTAHFNKICVTVNDERNTIEEIKIYNKASKLVTQFNFSYSKIQDFWMNKTVTTKIFIGNTPLVITQAYSETNLNDIPDATFDIQQIKQNRGGK